MQLRDPNRGPFQPAVEWVEYDPTEQNYLLQSQQYEMRSFYDNNEVDLFRFWIDHFKPMMSYPPPATFPPGPSATTGDQLTFLLSRHSFSEYGM